MPFFEEESLRTIVLVAMRLVEASGASVIFLGAVIASVRVLVSLVARRGVESFAPIRLDMARFLALGLEFQLAADLLRTAIAPTFEEIGKLASVAAIRTALNFFLGREIDGERREMARAAERSAEHSS